MPPPTLELTQSSGKSCGCPAYFPNTASTAPYGGTPSSSRSLPATCLTAQSRVLARDPRRVTYSCTPSHPDQHSAEHAAILSDTPGLRAALTARAAVTPIATPAGFGAALQRISRTSSAWPMFPGRAAARRTAASRQNTDRRDRRYAHRADRGPKPMLTLRTAFILMAAAVASGAVGILTYLASASHPNSEHLPIPFVPASASADQAPHAGRPALYVRQCHALFTLGMPVARGSRRRDMRRAVPGSYCAAST